MSDLDGWAAATVGDRMRFEYGSALPAQVRLEGPYPVFGSSGRVGSHVDYAVAGPGVIVGRKGTVGAVTWTDDSFWPIDTTYFLSVDATIDLRWAYWKLQTLGLNRLDTSTGVPGLNRNDAYEMAIEVPSLPEQRRMAEILDTADDLIRSSERIVAKLKLVRKGLLQRLIAGAAAGRTESVSKLADTYSGGTPSRAVPGFYGGRIPWVKSGEVNRSSISRTDETITLAGMQASSARWVPADVPLIAMYGATAGVVSWTEVRVTTNQAVLAVVPRSSDVSARWLYWSLAFGSPKMLASVQGSGQPNLSKGIIDRFVLHVPAHSEQKRVAAILDTHESLIDSEVALSRKLVGQKIGLMSDLLTGRVRVPIEVAS